MAIPSLTLLSDTEINAIRQTSLAILEKTGVMIHHERMLERLAEAGATVNQQTKLAQLPENLIMDSIRRAARPFTLYGRDPRCCARFGQGDFVLMSSPGQYRWLDLDTGQRRSATLSDARDAIRLGDALDNITIVGAMAQPEEIAESYRDVFLTAELVKGTTKPTRRWVKNGKVAGYMLEIYRTVAGGAQALRECPMVEQLLEPISPLQLPGDGLDVVEQFARAGQPISVGPMAMCTGTAPGTLAGTLAQENAEILAGVVATQVLAPNTPMVYGGIPHIMDPRTSICSFGSPEQGLMGTAMVQIARSYGLPAYINVGLTDAKVPDAQAGMEKGSTLLLGALAGADTFGHCGICGTDHAGSLLWLALDNELGHYVKRMLRGFDIAGDTLGAEVIQSVGPAGHFLAEPHTVEHFRRELWLCGPAWTRENYDTWADNGASSMAERLTDTVKQTLATHRPEPLDPALVQEIDRIVACAKKELG